LKNIKNRGMSEDEPNRILIVDDEPGNLFLLEGLLSEEGFTVYAALNGKDAIALAKKELPDVILLDIMMPVVTGMDVLEILMKDPDVSRIPVIMVTAKVEAEDLEEAMRKGAVEYIKKPINEVEMLARLRTVLRLKKQEDMLRRLLESKEDFIAMVSHDVRGPFVSIAGFADMLLTDKALTKCLSKDHKEFLTFIIDTSNYVYDYFNKLLDWANLGAKRITLKKETINLSKLVHTNVLIFQQKIHDKELHLKLKIEDAISFYADPVYFSQVINNLLSNAIKYTGHKGKITLSAEQTDQAIYIRVADTGVGIGDTTAEELFEKTFHKSTRGTSGEKGTGVGLRICKMILDAHGYDLSFTSKPHMGTEFTIKIPNI
jgi:two-component system, sensor histidine kinase and response regulator